MIVPDREVHHVYGAICTKVPMAPGGTPGAAIFEHGLVNDHLTRIKREFGNGSYEEEQAYLAEGYQALLDELNGHPPAIAPELVGVKEPVATDTNGQKHLF